MVSYGPWDHYINIPSSLLNLISFFSSVLVLSLPVDEEVVGHPVNGDLGDGGQPVHHRVPGNKDRRTEGGIDRAPVSAFNCYEYKTHLPMSRRRALGP